jgi:glycine/D-amino acid oxidase-like deaminating enzyme
MADLALSPGLRAVPYWWHASPLQVAAEAAIPAAADVAIVGSGLTGLNAALVLARAGRSVIVLEAGDLGQGASTRNAGYVGRTLKHRFRRLLDTLGPDAAVAVYREMQAAFDAVAEIIANEGIDCGFRRCGRFIPAPSPAAYENLARELAAQNRYLGVEFAMVPKHEQHRELGSDRYCGGAVVPDLAGLHPGLYHAGLLRAARSAGAAFAANAPVERIGRASPAHIEVVTRRGTVTAREVIVATNGYAGRATPWLQRRMVPFDAFMIATEALPTEAIDRALPTARTIIDWANDVRYVRRSPDGRSILFGALTGRRPGDLAGKARALAQMLGDLLPDLRRAPIAHVWSGRCAATFDLYPHLNRLDGVTYVGGYCFAGVPMGTYLGRKAALAILGSPEGRTHFAERRFPALPLYRGNPWFVPAVMGYYRWLDRRSARPRRSSA